MRGEEMSARAVVPPAAGRAHRAAKPGSSPVPVLRGGFSRHSQALWFDRGVEKADAHLDGSLAEQRRARRNVRDDERLFRATGGGRVLRGPKLDGSASASRLEFLSPEGESRAPETPRLDPRDVMFNAYRTGDHPCTWSF